VNIEDLADKTKNFSGAEIEGLIKSAVSFSQNRQVDSKNIRNPDTNKLKIIQQDHHRICTNWSTLFQHCITSITHFVQDSPTKG